MNGNPASKPQSFLQGLLVVLAPTLVLGFLSFVYATLDNARKEQLEFVRGQIVDLYGPLYTLSAAFEHVWEGLGSQHGNIFEAGKPPPGHHEIVLLRKLLRTVVEPLSSQIETTLLSSKQSIRCAAVRDALQEFVVFAESVKLVIATWKTDEDVSDTTKHGNMPEAAYPRNLPNLLQAELVALHARENQLDNGFFGLFVGPAAHQCAKLPAPAS